MSLLDDAVGIVTENPIASTIGAGIVGVGVGVGATSLLGSKSSTGSKRTSRRKITHTKRGWKQDRKRFNRSQKWEVAYRKRKAKRRAKHSRRSRKGKHYTKNGQPYIILASGKARFVKK